MIYDWTDPRGHYPRHWDPYGRDQEAAATEGMRFPVRCRCGGIYDLAKVEVTARYTDCSMWKAPCCGRLADDRKPPWGISHYEELPRFDAADWHGPECEDSEETGR